MPARRLPFSLLVILLVVPTSVAHASTTRKRAAKPQHVSYYVPVKSGPALHAAGSQSFGGAPFPGSLGLPSSPDNWRGGTGTWSNSAEWTTGLPGTSNDVLINTGNDNVTLDTNSNINSLTLGGSSGSSSLTGDGNGHTVTIAGALTVNQSGTLLLNGDTFTAGASSNNSGNIQLNGNASLSRFTVNGDFANSGTFLVTDDGPGNLVSISGTVTNSSGGSLLLGTYDDGFGTSVINIGRLVNNGDLDINVTLNLTNEPGGITDIVAGSSLTVDLLGTFKAGGNDPFANLTSVEGGLALAGQGATVNPQGGTLTISRSGSISVGNSVSFQVNGNVNNAGSMSTGYPYTDPPSGGNFGVGALTNSGYINLSMGTMGVGGAMSNTGSVSLYGSSLSVSGNLTNAGTIAFYEEIGFYCGCNTLTVNGNLINSGQITTEFGSNTVTISGKLTNTASSLFSLGGTTGGDTANIGYVTNAGSVLLNGNLNVTGGSHAPVTALPGFLNSGIVNVTQGSTLFDALSFVQTSGQTTVDGTLQVAGHSLINLAGGSLYGNGGAVEGNITSNASIQIGDAPMTVGALTFMGNYTQGANGSLTFDIAGNAPGQYDQLNVTGHAQLNGLMTVDLLNGYIPQLGNTFEIMTYGSESGTFSMVVGLPINNQEHFVLEYNSSNLTLDVQSGQISGPTTKGGSGTYFVSEPFISTAGDGSSSSMLAQNNPPGTATPEPPSIVFFASGLAGIGGMLLRKHKV